MAKASKKVLETPTVEETSVQNIKKNGTFVRFTDSKDEHEFENNLWRAIVAGSTLIWVETPEDHYTICQIAYVLTYHRCSIVAYDSFRRLCTIPGTIPAVNQSVVPFSKLGSLESPMDILKHAPGMSLAPQDRINSQSLRTNPWNNSGSVSFSVAVNHFAEGLTAPHLVEKSYEWQIDTSHDVSNPAGKQHVMVLYNAHWMMSNPQDVQQMSLLANKFKETRQSFILMSPQFAPNPVLEKQIHHIKYPLPTRNQIYALGNKVPGINFKERSEEEVVAICNAASGLTITETVSAFQFSATHAERDARSIVKQINATKCERIKASSALSMLDKGITFRDLGGLTAVKEDLVKMISSNHPVAKPNGVMLLGVTGGGKSALCSALGAEVNLPTIQLNMGAIFGSLVGQSEGNFRKSVDVVESMAPCILMIDEVEKAMPRLGSHDGGVSSRLMGSMLTWLQDKKANVFVICTCNDISSLPSEFTRAGRFDSLYFIDIPPENALLDIWTVYINKFRLDKRQTEKIPNLTRITGAEIESCCSRAAIMGETLTESMEKVTLAEKVNAEQWAKLRDWANERCLDAHVGGIYQNY